MTRLCVIGNSHLAMFKRGWERLPDRSGLHVDFFGSPGTEIKFFEEENGCLVPGTSRLREMVAMTSGGLNRIDPGSYDAFVIVGAAFGIQPLIQLHRNYRSERHRMANAGRAQLVSNACFHESASGLLKKSLAMRVHAKLLRITDKAVYLVPQPNPSEAVRDSKTESHWNTIVESGDNKALVETYSAVTAELAEPGLHILPVPDETTVDLVFTQRSYSRGGVMISPTKQGLGETVEDFLHMNEDYGLAVLRSFLHRLPDGGILV